MDNFKERIFTGMYLSINGAALQMNRQNLREKQVVFTSKKMYVSMTEKLQNNLICIRCYRAEYVLIPALITQLFCQYFYSYR